MAYDHAYLEVLVIGDYPTKKYYSVSFMPTTSGASNSPTKYAPWNEWHEICLNATTKTLNN